jgi:hypothetical protein
MTRNLNPSSSEYICGETMAGNSRLIIQADSDVRGRNIASGGDESIHGCISHSESAVIMAFSFCRIYPSCKRIYIVYRSSCTWVTRCNYFHRHISNLLFMPRC